MSKEKTAHREVFKAVLAWMLKWEIRIPDPAKGRFAGMELEATLKKLVLDRTVDAELLEAQESEDKHTPGPSVSIESLCGCAWKIHTPAIAADAVEATVDVRCPVHNDYDCEGLRIQIRLPGAINAELLEACKAFVHFAELPGDKVPRDEYIVYQVNALGAAKAAIAKAEGK